MEKWKIHQTRRKLNSECSASILGQILNKFSKDVGIVDIDLNRSFFDFSRVSTSRGVSSKLLVKFDVESAFKTTIEISDV